MDASSLWLSADWGTSNFRLRMVDGAALRVLAETSSITGVASVYEKWKDELTHLAVPERAEQRIAFYQNFLQNQIRHLESVSGRTAGSAPVVLSGMASSSIGMKMLPYQSMPCPSDGSGLTVVTSAACSSFPFPLALVSGVCSEDDMMRGEETMLIGAVAANGEAVVDDCYIFPGTHSKHVFTTGKKISKLRTYMTGELFALLCEKSILAGSVEYTEPLSDVSSFEAGLSQGWSGQLTHSLFTVRSADLLGKRNKKSNGCFLSGLLIGHELKDLEGSAKLHLISSGALTDAYVAAIGRLLASADLKVTDSVKALIQGQRKIAEQVF